MNTLTYLLDKYPDKPWSYYMCGISSNPNITMEMIDKYPDKPWNWEYISKNPNITIEFIEKNINKIDFERLSENKFTYQNKLNRINKRVQIIWCLDHIFNNVYIPNIKKNIVSFLF